MISNPYSGQFDQQVLCADPIELVGIIFEHLMLSIAEARQYLVCGDRMARGRAIAKGIGLLGELARSLDKENGGELARNLSRIYSFAADSLTRAQSEQIEKPLIEAAEALRPLRDAWVELHQTRSNDMDGAYTEVYSETAHEPGMRFAISV